jgi:hypothetical protein
MPDPARGRNARQTTKRQPRGRPGKARLHDRGMKFQGQLTDSPDSYPLV